ncbi:hypothetical protein Tco_0573681 [Tanacetum coccineum]
MEATVVVGCRGTAAEVREGAARDREWVWGSDRSVDKEYVWSSPEKPAGKVFRRRRGDGRRWLVAAGFYGRERERDIIECSGPLQDRQQQDHNVYTITKIGEWDAEKGIISRNNIPEFRFNKWEELAEELMR